MSTPGLSQQVFSILATLVEEHAGLHYTVADLELFEQKVAPRAVEAGFDSLLDYYYFLRYDPKGPEAIQQLIEALTVHETYFFREYDALRALTAHFIVPAAKAGRRLRVWCAACATGEEPLSLAMMLAREGVLNEVSIVASDVSSNVLDRATRGEFNRRSIRWVPPGFLGELLVQSEERVTVAPAVRSAVEFKKVNLIDPVEIRALGAFDVVLCRNVLIYFKDQTALKVIESLVGALAPDGKLLVGASESLLRFGTELECTEVAGSFFYEKVRP